MKKFLLVLTLIIAGISTSFAQQTVKPTIDKQVVSQLTTLDYEGVVYDNVTVKMKCSVKMSGKMYTKITVYNQNNKKVFKKTFNTSLLYVFDSGQIQIGKNGFSQMLIWKEKDGTLIGKIRETQGVNINEQ